MNVRSIAGAWPRARAGVDRGLLRLEDPRLAWAIVAAAVAFRLLRYLAAPSVWLDEAALALNVRERSFAGLLGVLDHDQGAPLGFLLGTKLLVSLFGDGEYVLRLLPLAFGVGASLLFLPLARRIVDDRAVPLALALFAVSTLSIRYASEFKQYAGDLFFAIAILSIGRRLLRASGTDGVRSIAAVGIAAIGFSHAAVFTLGGVGSVLFGAAWLRRDRPRLRALALACTGWAALFLGTYLLSIREMVATRSVFQWQEAFLHGAVTRASWIDRSAEGMRAAFLGSAPPGLEWWAALLAVCGVVSLARRRPHELLLLLSPLPFLAAASYSGAYPVLIPRLWLFFAPATMLLVAAGARSVRIGPARTSGPLAVACLVPLLASPLIWAVRLPFDPWEYEEMRPVVRHVREHWREGDRVLVDPHARLSFLYYAGRYRFEERDFVAPVPDPAVAGDARRVWALFTTVGERGRDAPATLEALSSVGRRLHAFGTPQVSVHLFALDAPAEARSGPPRERGGGPSTGAGGAGGVDSLR